MANAPHTVVELPEYLSDAKSAGMTANERMKAKLTYAATPDMGEEIVGSGGVRKGRLAGRGKGKSGGYRIVSLYLDADYPVLLLAVLNKGDRETYSDAEVKDFKKIATATKAAFRGRKRR